MLNTLGILSSFLFKFLFPELSVSSRVMFSMLYILAFPFHLADSFHMLGDLRAVSQLHGF